METKLIHADQEAAVVQALAALRAGELVAFPTDTVYGVGALAFDQEAVERIYVAKGRSTEKAIPILIADPDDLDKVTSEVTPVAGKLAARYWPGPLTLVVPSHPSLPDNLSPQTTVGVRVPDHPVARALLRAAGPMAVTSANRSGEPSPSTAQEVLDQLGGRIALILDGGQTPGGVPSTVVSCLGPDPLILRAGPISSDEIQALLGNP